MDVRRPATTPKARKPAPMVILTRVRRTSIAAAPARPVATPKSARPTVTALVAPASVNAATTRAATTDARTTTKPTSTAVANHVRLVMLARNAVNRAIVELKKGALPTHAIRRPAQIRTRTAAKRMLIAAEEPVRHAPRAKPAKAIQTARAAIRASTASATTPPATITRRTALKPTLTAAAPNAQPAQPSRHATKAQIVRLQACA